MEGGGVAGAENKEDKKETWGKRSCRRKGMRRKTRGCVCDVGEWVCGRVG